MADENESTGKNGSAVFNFRLPREELVALEKAARAAGMSTSEYVRRAIAARPHQSVLIKPQIGWVASTPYFQYGSQITWSDNPCILTEYQVDIHMN
jgi:hypothetical protein